MKQKKNLIKIKEDIALELFNSDGGLNELILLNIIFEAYIQLVEAIDKLILNLEQMDSYANSYTGIATST